MTTTQTPETSAKELAAMFGRKYMEATKNGASDDQAIKALREMWLEALRADDTGWTPENSVD